MSKFHVGDKVRLKSGLKVGRMYNGFFFNTEMVFDGASKIRAIDFDGAYWVGDYPHAFYTDEMLEEAAMSEQRLIDANSEKIFRVDPDSSLDRGYACGWNGMVSVVEHLPTIDPETLPIVKELREKLANSEPVVHAHWERIGNSDSLTSELISIMHPESPKTVSIIFKCSKCGRKVSFLTPDDDKISERFAKQYPYCHCGAKMST